MLINELLFSLMCIEGVICLILSIPFFRNMTQKIVQFLMTNVFTANSHMNLLGNVLLGVIGISFLSNLQTTWKYSNSDEVLSDGMRIRVLMAQRDTYISGFSLFLFGLLRMTYNSLCRNIKLEKSFNAMEKQAKGASSGYSKLLEEHEVLQKQMKKLKSFDTDGNAMESILAENAKLDTKVTTLEKQVNTTETQLKSIKKQAENQQETYMKLLDNQSEQSSQLSAMAGLKDEMKTLQTQIKELETERDQLKTQIQDYDFMFADAKKKAL